MAAEKFVKLTAGQLGEQGATQAGGGGNENKIPALDATGRLAATMMPVGVVPEVIVAPASEALDAGDYVNLFNDTGTLKARKADCSNGRKVDGFVLAAVELAANATIYTEGNNTGVTGRTVGAVQYLSTAGDLAETPTSTAGQIVQEVGKAISATEVTFDPKASITLA